MKQLSVRGSLISAGGERSTGVCACVCMRVCVWVHAVMGGHQVHLIAIWNGVRVRGGKRAREREGV